MKKIKVLLILALAGLLSTACSNAQNNLCTVGAEEVKAADKEVVFIDVRTPEEYQEGHLPDAKLINIHDDDFLKEINKLEKNQTYYIYCRSGKRSAKAQDIMLAQGFKNVCNTEGGVLKLQKEGIELVK